MNTGHRSRWYGTVSNDKHWVWDDVQWRPILKQRHSPPGAKITGIFFEVIGSLTVALGLLALMTNLMTHPSPVGAVFDFVIAIVGGCFLLAGALLLRSSART